MGSSPPPEERQMVGMDHRSRRDANSPPGRRRIIVGRDDMGGREDIRYRGKDLSLPAARARSHSAAPTDSPSLHVSRSRSKSPRRQPEPASRSLSPPEARPGYGGTSRMPSRSATATPTGSPKKRQLPQIPPSLQHANRDKVTQDLEERARQMKLRMRQMTPYRSVGPGSTHLHSGHSDSELGMRTYDRYSRGRGGLVSPERDPDHDFGDSASDIESVVSVTSAFSTQSERPRGSRKHSRRHPSSLKSNAQSYDITLDDHPTILTDFDHDYSHSLSCSLLDTIRPLVSPVRRPPFLRKSLSMGMSAGVSRSAPHLAVLPRQTPHPRGHLLRSQTAVNVFPQARPRHRLQKSHSLGETDKHWHYSQNSNILDDQWKIATSVRDPSYRGRSRSLTRDDLLFRSNPKKTVTYEDEILSKRRARDAAIISQSSLSVDKSVPYESDLVVRDTVPDSYLSKNRSHSQRGTLSDLCSADITRVPAREAYQSIYRRRSSGLGDGHSAGTYYGYDSEYSGAETEVFLSDRSLDRSFSLEQLDNREMNVEMKRGLTKALSHQDKDDILTASLQAVREGSSHSLPRMRRPSRSANGRRTFTRANTESSLLKCPNKSVQLDGMYRPSKNDPEALYRLPLRESSVNEPSQEEQRPLDTTKGLHSNPTLAHIFDRNIGSDKYDSCGSDDVFAPLEQKRHVVQKDFHKSYVQEGTPDMESQQTVKYGPSSVDNFKYHSPTHDERYHGPIADDPERDHERVYVESKRYGDIPTEEERCRNRSSRGQRYNDSDSREKESYEDQASRDQNHYRFSESKDHRYRNEEQREQDGYRGKDRYTEVNSRCQESYRNEESRSRGKHREYNQARYREEDQFDSEKFSARHVVCERFPEQGNGAYREQMIAPVDDYSESYRKPITPDKEQYRDQSPIEADKYTEQERFREEERYKAQGGIARRQSSVGDERPRRHDDIDHRKYRDSFERDRIRDPVEEEIYRDNRGEYDRYHGSHDIERGYCRDHPPPGFGGPEDDYFQESQGPRCQDIRDRERYGSHYDRVDGKSRTHYDYESQHYSRDPLYQQDARGHYHPSSGHDPNFHSYDPARPHDRRDTASHMHSSHPHDLAHAHAHPNNTHGHSSNTHQTYEDPSYPLVESNPVNPTPDMDLVAEGESPDIDRPLTPRVRHSSSVSINEHPEYFEFDANSPPSTEPRADADVDPSSNPASEFSHQRMTAFGPGGVYGGSSKRGQLGRSLSTSEVPETEKAEVEVEGGADIKEGEASAEGDVEEVEGVVEVSAVEVEGCEEGEVVVGEEEECLEGECSVEGSNTPPENAGQSSNLDSLDVEKLGKRVCYSMGPLPHPSAYVAISPIFTVSSILEYFLLIIYAPTAAAVAASAVAAACRGDL
ncbi:hypothetical protein SK128_020585 [Halocaridina rubra]|uniref:Uncharacterized protein n=1 Tax=Halocaridina rubra TaxID=373956 RepID=A0AAN8WAV6_HALRR